MNSPGRKPLYVALLRIDLLCDPTPFSFAADPDKHNTTTIKYPNEFFLKDITLPTFLHLQTYSNDHGNIHQSPQSERKLTKPPGGIFQYFSFSTKATPPASYLAVDKKYD
jgi:hypothetical protein